MSETKISVVIKLSTGKKIELNEAELNELKEALNRLARPEIYYPGVSYPIYPNVPSTPPWTTITTSGGTV